MLRNLFESFESDESEQLFHNAMMEQIINGDIRDAYMRSIHDNSSSLTENQLMDDPLFNNGYDDSFESSISDIKTFEEMYECGDRCCDSFSDDGNDFIDDETKRNINILPETDPTDVGSYFDNTSSTAAECNESAFNKRINDGMELVNMYIR